MSDAAGDGVAARRSQAAGQPQRLAWLLIGLGIVSRTLRSRRFHERVIVGAIALAALSSLGRESQARSLEHLVAYAKRMDQRAEHAIKPRAR